MVLGTQGGICSVLTSLPDWLGIERVRRITESLVLDDREPSLGPWPAA